MPDIRPITIILRFWDNILNKLIFSILFFKFISNSMHANKLTNVVENTNPFTPKLIGDKFPHGLDPPIRNQSKNKLRNIAKLDILNGVFESSIP